MEIIKLKILFVDDDPNVLNGLRRMLRSMRDQWETFFANSGVEALDFLARQEVDVVVSDMRMPGMDGAELLQTVKERYPHVIRIILSGQSDRRKVFETVKVAHQYLSKPCDDATLKATIERSRLLYDLLGDRSLKEVVSRIESLPSLPALYFEILQELESDYCFIQKVGEIIARDIGMTAKILQLVNSAFFGFYHHVSSPVQAAELLGTEVIKVLVLSEKIFSSLDHHKLAAFKFESLWEHSLVTGLTAKTIARKERHSQTEIDQAFMAGVLHDSGKLVLAANFPDKYKETTALAQEAGLFLWEAERRVLGVSHGEIGAYLLALWGLPEAIVDAIARHHEPPRLNTRVSLRALIYASNLLEHAARGQSGAAGLAALREQGWGEKLAAWQETCEHLVNIGEGNAA
ncbi:MAG: HDOD domain-containing protein [Desulfobaccales bacterium]